MNLKEYYKEILNTRLTEDVQTKEREEETKGMSRAAGKKVQDAQRRADSAVEAARDVYGRTAKGDAGHRKALKTTLGAENKARDAYDLIRSLIGKEKRSKEMFGKGGKIVKEDIETPLRNAENNKAIKNLEGKAKEKKRIWNKVSDPHSDLPPHSDSSDAYKASWNRRMTRAYKASDKFVAAREKLEARIALQQKEQASKFRIGLGGKRRKTK